MKKKDTRIMNKGKKCSSLGCPNGATVKGLCVVHYKRLRRAKVNETLYR